MASTAVLLLLPAPFIGSSFPRILALNAGGGFVGAHYFIHRWKGHNIPDAPELRRQSLQRLLAQNRVQTYQVDGKTALRTLDDSVDFGMGDDRESGGGSDGSELDDEELGGTWSSDQDNGGRQRSPETVVRRVVRKK